MPAGKNVKINDGKRLYRIVLYLDLIDSVACCPYWWAVHWTYGWREVQ